MRITQMHCTWPVPVRLAEVMYGGLVYICSAIHPRGWAPFLGKTPRQNSAQPLTKTNLSQGSGARGGRVAGGEGRGRGWWELGTWDFGLDSLVPNSHVKIPPRTRLCGAKDSSTTQHR